MVMNISSTRSVENERKREREIHIQQTHPLHTSHSVLKASTELYRFVLNIQLKKTSNLNSSSSYVISCKQHLGDQER